MTGSPYLSPDDAIKWTEEQLTKGGTRPHDPLSWGKRAYILAAEEHGIPHSTMRNSLAAAARKGREPDWSLFKPTDHALQVAADRKGESGFKPVLAGFEIKRTTAVLDEDGELTKQFVTQGPERGPVFEIPLGLKLNRIAALTDGDGRIINQWQIATPDAQAQADAMRAAIEALKEDIPRAESIPPPASRTLSDLVNQFTITDAHFGCLSWHEETGADYDLKIAEKLLIDWFSTAIALAPASETAILAQLGDFLHYDSYKSITPEHGHLLDSDTRFQKLVRVVIRTLRQIIQMLLEKHSRVHIIMADANHDPASGAWLREMFAAFYDSEPRVTVDNSASTYYAYEHGLTSLFYHHGHRKKIKVVDTVFAAKFREIFGRTKYSFGHTGHRHEDELFSSNLMKIEQHETLAAPDAYAANGGWLSNTRSAKVITYSKRYGKVSDLVISAQMAADEDAIRIFS